MPYGSAGAPARQERDPALLRVRAQRARQLAREVLDEQAAAGLRNYAADLEILASAIEDETRSEDGAGSAARPC